MPKKREEEKKGIKGANIIIAILIIIIIAMAIYIFYNSQPKNCESKNYGGSEGINQNFSSEGSCNSKCLELNYSSGDCKFPIENTAINQSRFVNMGSCLIQNSQHCGKAELCNCYCAV